jgi:hypothetical protein
MSGAVLSVVELSHFVSATAVLAGLSVLVVRQLWSLDFVRARLKQAAKSSGQ